MLTITITIPSGTEQKILKSFETVYGLPEGTSQQANLILHLDQFLTDIHKQAQVIEVDVQVKEAGEQAREQALIRAETEASQITIV